MCPQPIPGPLVYDDGLSSNGAREWFKNMPLDVTINPDYICIFDDFTNLHGKALNATDMYDTSVKDAGASTALGADTLGGIATITSAATTGTDGGSIQMLNQCVQLQANKKLWFEARVKGSSVADQEMFVGLCKQIVTNPEDLLVANFARIGFELRASTAVVKASMGSGTADTVSSTGVSMADNTFIKLGFYFDGQQVQFFVDRLKKITTVASGVTPVIGTDLLSPAFESRSISAAGTRTGSIDYFMVIAER